jgi:hypothetical protein
MLVNISMKILTKTCRKNIGSNVFIEQMLVKLFSKKFVQLFMKNIGSTFV